MADPWRPRRLPRVLFGWMYEDFAVELAAFPPASRVLVIASAGDTAGALARAGHQVTAIDINPVQLAYASARLAGSPATTGAAERLTAAARAAAGALVTAWRPARLAPFLRLDEPARQVDWWRERLDRPALRRLMATALRPAGVLAPVVRPGLGHAVPRGFDVVLRRRLAACVSRHPNADNPWLWRLLLGEEWPGRVGPAPVPPVDWVCADVAAHLENAPPGRYDAVALSNVLDGAPPAYAGRLLRALRRAVRPGGVAVLRSFHDWAPLRGRYVTDRCPLWGAVVVGQIGD